MEHYSIVTKSTPSDALDEIHQVIRYGISDNMALLVESVKYGAINTTDTTTNGFYVIIFALEVYTLLDNTNIDAHVINAGELPVKAKYIVSMQLATNWY